MPTATEEFTYNDFEGPDLDAGRWIPARLPLPTGGEHLALDPNAEVAVGDGEVRVTISRFSLAHSAKYLIFSTRQFELPPDRPATFAVDQAVENIGGEPADYRRGMAAFAVFDIELSKRVFSAVGTSTRVFAMHEQVAPSGAGEPFFHVVESPYDDFDEHFHPASRLRDHVGPEQLDRGLACRRPQGVRGQHLDPRTPSIGFGIWTMLPDRDGRSQSLDGQGLNARWRRFRLSA